MSRASQSNYESNKSPSTTSDWTFREYAFGSSPLNLPFHNNYPKYILTRNDSIQQRNGIIHRNLPEFMRDGTTF